MSIDPSGEGVGLPGDIDLPLEHRNVGPARAVATRDYLERPVAP